MASTNPDPLHSRWQENIARWTGVSEPDAIKQYRLDQRLIRLQERNRELLARKRRVPYADGIRFLVTDRNQTAVYQSDDILAILEYTKDHPNTDVYDLEQEVERFEANQIGKHMAPRDREKTIVPQFNPDEGKAGRFGSPRETLLKDRKTVQVIPPPRDVTPDRVKLLSLVRHLRHGTPLIGQHEYTCKSCGYEAAACPCSRPMRRDKGEEAPRVRQETSDLVSKKQTLTTGEFIAKIRREAGLKEL